MSLIWDWSRPKAQVRAHSGIFPASARLCSYCLISGRPPGLFFFLVIFFFFFFFTLVFEESHTGSSVYVFLDPQFLLSSGVGGRDSKASSAAGAFLPEATRGARECTWILQFKSDLVGSGLGKVSPYSESTQRVLEISRVPGSPFGPTTGNFRGSGQICVFTACSLQMLSSLRTGNLRQLTPPKPAHKFLHSAFFFFFKSTNSVSSL